jgi:hypothetical protein
MAVLVLLASSADVLRGGRRWGQVCTEELSKGLRGTAGGSPCPLREDRAWLLPVYGEDSESQEEIGPVYVRQQIEVRTTQILHPPGRRRGGQHTMLDVVAGGSGRGFALIASSKASSVKSTAASPTQWTQIWSPVS